MFQAIINPYKAGPPVAGDNFYGRIKLLKLVRKDLNLSKVVLLQGQRRIGKTSFLKQLASSLMQQEELVYNVPIILDIQRYIQMSLPQFQLSLAEKIVKQLQLQGLIATSVNKEYSALFKANNVGLNVLELSKFEVKPNYFLDFFLPEIYDLLGHRSLIILVDEFDNFNSENSSQSMQALVPFLCQMVSGEERIKWVFALGKQIGKLPIQYDPIISSGTQRRISFLGKLETRQLLERPAKGILSYEPGAIDRIYKLTNGQPHLTQALGSEVFQYNIIEKNRNIVTSADVDKIIPSVLEVYGGAIASIVRVPPVEERILATITQLTQSGSTTTRDEIIEILLKKNINISRNELTDTLESLIEWKLVAGNLQDLRLSVELIKIWLEKNISAEASREESLSIQNTLANRRLELAEKERIFGDYESAIKDYQDTLKHIPSNVSALRGLAETYRLTENNEGRVKILQKLYLYDSTVYNEFVKALVEHAEQSEKEENFSVAAEQYDELIRLQDSRQWKQRLLYNLIESLKDLNRLAEEELESNLQTRDLIQKKIPNLEEIEIQLTKTMKSIGFHLGKNYDLSDNFVDCQTSTYKDKAALVLSRIKIFKSIDSQQYSRAALLLVNLDQELEKSGAKLTKNEESVIRITVIEIIKPVIIVFIAIFLLFVWTSYQVNRSIPPFLKYIFHDVPSIVIFKPIFLSLGFIDFTVNIISRLMHSITRFPDWIFRLPISIVLFLSWLILSAIIIVTVCAIFDLLFLTLCRLFLKFIVRN